LLFVRDVVKKAPNRVTKVGRILREWKQGKTGIMGFMRVKLVDKDVL